MKSLYRIYTLALKEWIHIIRDARSLILALVAPAILILLFGYALTTDVTHVKTAVFDGDKSALSRAFMAELFSSEYLSLAEVTGKMSELDNSLNRGTVKLALIIPPGFENNYNAGKECSVALLVDGSDSTSSAVSLSYVKAITARFNSQLSKKEMSHIGVTNINPPLSVQTRVWYNPEMTSKNFIVPGLIVLILAIISALITSLTISREWERGTMETLITTPVRPHEVIFGKMIPYLFIGLFDVLTAVCIGYFLFGVPMKGSFILLTMLSLLFLIGTSGMGILISTVTKVQVLSVQAALVATYLPSFILSGFIFPINNMPVFIQAVTYLVPAKYLIVIINGIALKGAAASVLRIQIMFLAAFAFIVIVLALKKLSLTIED